MCEWLRAIHTFWDIKQTEVNSSERDRKGSHKCSIKERITGKVSKDIE